MAAIGIRELKQTTSKVLRRVRERGEEIDVTYRGEVIARIVPVARASKARARATRAVWDDLDRLAREIGAVWPKGVSAVRAVREQRRG